MSTYWNQWSYAELMSMQGIEIDEHDVESYQEEHDVDSNQVLIDVNRRCPCYGGCTKCLE